MREKLISRWDHLNNQRYHVGNAYIYPIIIEMERIQKVLKKRYNYTANYC